LDFLIVGNDLSVIRLRNLFKWSVLFVGVAVVAIQFVPYGRDHTNPPASAEPRWDSARTRELAVESCYSCHSNETEWPWYSNIAPMSWLIQRDVDSGRDELNFSELEDEGEADDAADTVADGEMPPLRYVLANPSARLSSEEKRDLIDGFTRTFGNGDNSGPGDVGNGDDENNSGPGGGDDEDDNSGPGS
jgi:Haem-binding domain